MNTETMPYKKVHHGRNIKRLREMLGVKQESIAIALEMTQQNVSLLEQKEEIEDKIIEKVAKVLNVPAEAIKNFNEDAAVNIITNTFSNSDTSTAVSNVYHYSFNPIEKIVELYERMLKAEQEKNVLLEEIVKGK